MAAAVGMIAGCQKPEMVQIAAPEDVVAPALESIADIVITKENLSSEAVTIKWSAADFGAKTQINYAVEIAASNGGAKHVLTSGITDTSSEITYQTLNTFLLSELAFEPNVASDVYFFISAKVGEYAKVYSEALKAVVTPMEAAVPEVDLYDHVWVIGDYCGWDHGKTQFLYNYAKDGNIYNGVVDFGEKAANGFKLTGVGGWDDTCNWGTDGDAAAPEAEASSITLISSGGSGNISCYSKRFYNFEFEKGSLTLKVKNSFNQLGVIGDFNGWGGDVVMNYNPRFVRFYADVEIPADGGLKVRVDADWATSWGVPENGDDITAGPVELGGANGGVKAGNYRIYLDLNKGTIEASAKMYGQPEPGVDDVEPEPEPEPEPVPANKGWGLIGVAGNWDVDVPMTESNGVWTAYVTLGENESFKFRKDGAWDENFGGVFVALDTPFEAVAGGANIEGVPAGFYKMVLNTIDNTITISEGDVWSLIGQVNGANWDKDVIMTQDGDKWVSPVVTIDGEFKIRHNLDWTLSYGIAEGVEVKLDEALAATSDNGGNIKLEAGDYKVTLDLAAETILITKPAFPETMYMIGQDFGGWDWASDGIVSMNPVAGDGAGQFWAIRYVDAANGFKFCSKREWNGDFHSLTTNTGYTVKDGNCFVPESGLYMIHIDLKREMIHMEPARVYGIGDCFGSWDAEKAEYLFAAGEDGKTVSATLAADGQIRMFAASGIANTDWWTREFIFFNGEIAYRGNGGDQERVNGTAGQVVTLDFNAGTATLQ